MSLRKLFLWVLAILGGIAIFWMVGMNIIYRMLAYFGIGTPCPASLARLLDNPVRRRYTGRILDRIGIQPGERVLELGPGPGVFTVEAAGRVGPEGRLIAVDIQPGMIAQVEKRVREAGLTNVETHVASAYELPMEDASLERAFLVTVLYEIPDVDKALRELRRVLKPGGVLSITEQFPDPDYPFPGEAIRRVERAGFHLIERSGSFWMYTLNFEKV